MWGTKVIVMETQEIAEVLNGLRIIVQALRVSSRGAEKASGLSGAQLFVLQKLRELPNASLTQIATATHTHQSSVSVVVAKLVKQGLVRRSRSDADGRQLILELTTQGSRKLERSPVTAQDMLLEGLKRMKRPDRSRLAKGLSTMIQLAGFERQLPTLFFEEHTAVSERGK